jgi:hypothetical protein
MGALLGSGFVLCTMGVDLGDASGSVWGAQGNDRASGHTRTLNRRFGLIASRRSLSPMLPLEGIETCLAAATRDSS